MLELHVKKDGGDYSTIMEAINAVPYEEQAMIHIGEGTFKEKIFSDKRDIVFMGEGPDKTIIEYDDGAFDEMEDGTKRGTFRSYTAFFGGKKVAVKDMTISNTAGPGEKRGQAIAVYADAEHCLFENVKMLGYQDTLFCAPLPFTERQKNGFFGPRVYTPRIKTRQHYVNCQIFGDVDFIFGGADAVFDNCFIQCNNRYKDETKGGAVKDGSTADRHINGYITAASGLKDDLGFVFRNCTITGEKGCEPGSVFLGRPWREQARTVFLNCKMDDCIAKERFSGWGAVQKDEPETFYGEFGTKGLDGSSFADLSYKNPWVKEITEEIYNELNRRSDEYLR
ncbi:MAG: pectin esterase [Butyrivibrio sp.]|nr:pectin esterase [Butyrivibrio sp.]